MHFQVIQRLKFLAKTSYEEIGPLNKTLPVLPQVDRREVVQTPRGGKSVVIRQGNPCHPALITYHDLGLNYSTNFQVCISKYKYFFHGLSDYRCVSESISSPKTTRPIKTYYCKDLSRPWPGP